jgi:hypothetical protein
MLQVVVVVFMTTAITYLILRLLLLNLQLKLNSTRVSVGLYRVCRNAHNLWRVPAQCT